MRVLSASVVSLFTSALLAQDPLITGWVLNPGSETGYGGIASNVQEVNYTATDVYVSCTCIPGYDIGPWAGNPNVPANQDFTFRFTRNPVENTGTDVATGLGHIGVLRNGVSIFNAKDAMSWNNQGVWLRNAAFFEANSFDLCLGHPSPTGEYHNHITPSCVYDVLADDTHSELIGHAFDGFPIYGAHAFANADGSGGIARMRSSYQLRNITERTTLPDGTVLNASQHGPAVNATYPLGAFIEDYEYVAGSGDLDEHNGRFAVTPDFPEGHYVYHSTIDADSEPAYPYFIGPTYYGTVQPGNTGPQSGHNTIPSDAVLYDPSTGLAEAASAITLTLFPVPAGHTLGIRALGSILQQAQVRDAQGRIVLTERLNGTEAYVALDALTAGLYTVQLTTADGNVWVRGFVKE
ncbi:MAG TPA: YHYH protein [Flavobacteriales bacterium]